MEPSDTANQGATAETGEFFLSEKDRSAKTVILEVVGLPKPLKSQEELAALATKEKQEKRNAEVAKRKKERKNGGLAEVRDPCRSTSLTAGTPKAPVSEAKSTSLLQMGLTLMTTHNQILQKMSKVQASPSADSEKKYSPEAQKASTPEIQKPLIPEIHEAYWKTLNPRMRTAPHTVYDNPKTSQTPSETADRTQNPNLMDSEVSTSGMTPSPETQRVTISEIIKASVSDLQKTWAPKPTSDSEASVLTSSEAQTDLTSCRKCVDIAFDFRKVTQELETLMNSLDISEKSMKKAIEMEAKLNGKILEQEEEISKIKKIKKKMEEAHKPAMDKKEREINNLKLALSAEKAKHGKSDDLKIEVENLKQKLKTTEAAGTQKIDELDRKLRLEKLKLEDAQTYASQKMEDLNKQLKSEKIKSSKLEKELVEVKKDAENEKSLSQSKLQQSSAKFSRLQCEYSRIKTSEEDLQKEHNRLLSKTSEQDLKIRMLENTKIVNDQKLQQKENQITGMANRINFLEQQVQSLKESRSVQESKMVMELQQKVKNLETQKKESDATIAFLTHHRATNNTSTSQTINIQSNPTSSWNFPMPTPPTESSRFDHVLEVSCFRCFQGIDERKETMKCKKCGKRAHQECGLRIDEEDPSQWCCKRMND